MNKNAKRTKAIANIGTINLDSMEILEDSLSISLDVCEVSEEIRQRIDEAIEQAKKRYEEDLNRPWIGGHVIDFLVLGLEINKGATSYRLTAGYVSDANDNYWDTATVDIELTDEDAAELKKLAVKAVIDKFF